MKIISSVLIVAMALTANIASAALVINREAVGTTFSIDYAGTVLGFADNNLSALGNFVYTGASNSGLTYNFTYALTNDSTEASRLRSFGFDVTGATVSALAATGSFATPIQNSLSGLIGTDVCFSASGSTCATGSGGLTAGQTGSGSFALTFTNVMASVQLSDFAVAYQAVNGIFGGSGFGDAVSVAPVSAAPESATWVMLIGGFGLIGWCLRRRPVERLVAALR